MNLLSFARYVGIFNRQTQAYITAAFSSMNISFSEYILLMNLYNHEGINQEDISSILFIDKAAIARSIKSLEEKGYISREVAIEDRRSKKLFLTDLAKKDEKYLYSILERWENYTTEGLDIVTKDQIFKGLETMAEKSASINLSDVSKYERRK
ncbi:MarR family transcriptional regulator [Lachnotalea glycerini]|uniref:MarR family transcriptional regulator n=1 Tax=Lachnotalea glycerini TaxID=1763509 RepID=A0A318ERH7_9FIRM|nr:MarR family transcriptional regulator [Lachnotalea glycerini]PXV95561.1 MarR family transcriptional regulator [Lachnotalea glycerini]